MEHPPQEPAGSDPHEEIFREADREIQGRRHPEAGEQIDDESLAYDRALLDDFDGMYETDPDERL